MVTTELYSNSCVRQPEFVITTLTLLRRRQNMTQGLLLALLDIEGNPASQLRQSQRSDLSPTLSYSIILDPILGAYLPARATQCVCLCMRIAEVFRVMWSKYRIYAKSTHVVSYTENVELQKRFVLCLIELTAYLSGRRHYKRRWQKILGRGDQEPPLREC